MGFPWQGAGITFYIWCAIGAVIGWLAGTLMGSVSIATRLEEVAVGIFGAFIGADFIAPLLVRGDPVAGGSGFSIVTLIVVVVTVAIGLALLRMMRRVVGPMRNSKSRAGRRP
ncbi:MAG TPA: hypothetical protein VHL79_03300 [Ramlibacter sp.]|jgi:uncharacterized membrane protein YeaQ/YmgE (transglycosylase-associated protein family)|nr:hypothetical protein [Ramlibacter sp.]